MKLGNKHLRSRSLISFLVTHFLFMNCDRRCICSGAAVSCLQKHRDLVAKSPFPLTSGISRSNCDKPRLVWPECSKVWCCYVWINHQVGWRVRWSVSVTACRPPTTPAFTFCLETTCLQSIDGVLVTSVVVKISHNDLWSSGVQNPLNPAEWGALCFKNNNSAADSHPFMWSFGGAQHVAARNSYDRLSVHHCKRGVMHLWITWFLPWGTLNGRVCWNPCFSWRKTRGEVQEMTSSAAA